MLRPGSARLLLSSACAATHLSRGPSLLLLARRRDARRGAVRLPAAGPLRGDRDRLRRTARAALGRRSSRRRSRWDEQIPTCSRVAPTSSCWGCRSRQAGVPVAFCGAVPHDGAPGSGRSEDAERWPTPEALLETSPRIGVRLGPPAKSSPPAPPQRADRRLSPLPRRDRGADRVPHRRVRWRRAGDRGCRRDDLRPMLGAYPCDVESNRWRGRSSRGRATCDARQRHPQRWRSDGTLRQVLDTWPKCLRSALRRMDDAWLASIVITLKRGVETEQLGAPCRPRRRGTLARSACRRTNGKSGWRKAKSEPERGYVINGAIRRSRKRSRVLLEGVRRPSRTVARRWRLLRPCACSRLRRRRARGR